MRNFNKELDELFVEWETKSKGDGYNGFCRDGLMLKGKIFKGKEGYWGRTEGNENELWQNAPKRILFLMKDPNGNPNEDMRSWIGRQHASDITNRFFKNISFWLYGLNDLTRFGYYKCFEEINVVEKYSKCFDELPFSIVNCKKESGGSRIQPETLLFHVSKYGKFLSKQLEILNPDIIVCGGGSGTVLSIARKNIYTNLEFIRINDWIYYNKENDKVLIDSFHPSSIISYEEIYNDMMSSYLEHLKSLNHLS